MKKKKAMAGNIENAFKAGVWYTIATLVVKSIAIVSTPLYTRMMSTSDYGVSATFNTWYSLLFIICSLNVGYSIGRAKEEFKDKFDEYVGSLQILSSIVTCCIFCIIFLFMDRLDGVFGLGGSAIFCLFVYLLFGPIVSINQAKFRYKYLYRQNIFNSIFLSVGVVVFSLVFISSMETKYMGKIIGTTVPSLLLGIYYWVVSIRGGVVKFRKEYIVYAITFSVPLIVHSLSIYVLGQSDRLMIRHFWGDTATGVYSLVYQYSILVSLVTNSINQSWNPWFHDNYTMGNFELIKSKVRPLVLFGGFIGVCCIGVAPEAVLVLGGEKYLSGVSAVFPIALGVVCEFIYTQYVIIEMHLKKTKYISIGTFIAAVLNIGLNFIFIPKFGFVAAAYTTLVSYIVLLVVHNVITRVVLKVHLYRDLYMYLVLAGVAVLGFVCTLLYDYVIIRYMIGILFVCMFIFYNRDFIKGKLKRR